MSSSDDKIIISRLSPSKSIAGALTTLLICICLFFYLPQIMGGSKYIESVKKGHPNLYPSISFEDAFNKFYSNPKWGYYKSTTGNNIVTFSGKCNYDNKPVTIEMRYVLNSDNTFQLAGGTLNGEEQNLLFLTQFMSNPFISY